MTDPMNEPGGFGLVMPFVVTTSNGGPYADDAFVAGWEGGWLDAMLLVCRPLGVTIERYVIPSLVPQLDLLAMRHRYTMTAQPWDEDPDEWVLVSFAPAAVEAEQ
jgi:hypothetical protein